MSTVGPIEVTVRGTREEAFTAFVEDLGAWWPPPYSWGPRGLADHRVEPGVGGRVTEVADDGTELDWARVTAWEPGRRLELAWMIGPDRVPTPDARSRVVLTFDDDARGGTRVRVVHDRLDAHTGAGDAYAAGLGSPQGWPWIMERFADHCS